MRRRPSRTEEALEDLPADISYDRALDAALRLLTTRARSSFELRRRLTRVGFGEDIVARVEERLTELQILNDDEYALMFTQQGLARGLARARIRAELEARGLSPEPIDKALEEAGEESESERALALARRRSSTYGGYSPVRAFRRLAGFLAQKGYEEEVVLGVCRAVLGDVE